MTESEKARAFGEALERAKKLQETCDSNAVVGWCEYIFPELAESEDEKIRKRLIEFFSDWHKSRSHCWNIPVDKILTWLEKQKHTKKDVDIESMVKAYKQRIIKQDGMENNPLIDMCLASFKHGVENTLDELNGEQILANSANICKDEHSEQTNFTEFEEALADVCRGWIGEEIGWKDYIVRNANALLKISFKMWNEVQDAPFEQKPAWSEEDEDNLRFSERHFKTLLTNTYYDTFCNWLKSLKTKLGGE